MHPFSSNPYPPAANMGSWPYQVGPGYQPGSSDPIHTANMDLWPQGPEYQPGSSEPSPYPPAANMDSWPYQVGPEYQPCNSDPVSSSLYPPAVNMDLSPQGRGDQAGGSGHATPMQDSVSSLAWRVRPAEPPCRIKRMRRLLIPIQTE